jgi:hypothetical protein
MSRYFEELDWRPTPVAAVTFRNPLQDRPFTQTVYLARRWRR